MLFPLAEYWWFYAVFTAFVLVLLAVDLGVFHRKDYEITIREAAKFSALAASALRMVISPLALTTVPPP